MKFIAKPKVNNYFGSKEFENHMEAVAYLNNYNELGVEFKDEQGNYCPALKAEDWVMIGKLEVPVGIYFRDNKLMGKAA